jgi:multicomponent Na+:H+ antiporter subunit E
MTRRPWYLLWLALVWVVLWRGLSVGNVLAGLAVGAGVLLLFPPERRAHRLRVRGGPMVKLLGYFLWKLVEASAVVAWEIVTPKNKLNEGIVAVPLSTSSETVVTIIANAISLTPGTLTIEVDQSPSVLYVHVMHLQSVEAVRNDVHVLERLVAAAIVSESQPSGAPR